MASVKKLEQIFNRHTSFFINTQYSLWQAGVMEGSRLGHREDRAELFRWHYELARASKKNRPIAVTRVRNQRYPPSYALLDNLHPILLINLSLDVANRGYYLKLRVVSTAVQNHGIFAIVEDEASNYSILYANHHYDLEDANGLLPLLSVIIIKEPFYTCMYEGKRCIRVDHPSDIQEAYEGSRHIPSAWQKPIKKASVYNSAGVRAFENWENRKSLRMLV